MGVKQPLAPPSRPEGLLFRSKLNPWLRRAPGVELAFGSFRGGEKAPMLLVRIVVMMVLLASPANCSETKVVRSDTAYGCTSYQAYEFFGRFLAGGNAGAIQNALTNGECMFLSYGQEVVPLGKRPFLFVEIFRFPGDSRSWWTSEMSFLSAIQQEQRD